MIKSGRIYQAVCTGNFLRQLTLCVLLFISFGSRAETVKYSPAIISDSTTLQRFADSCLNNKAEVFLLDTYRELVQAKTLRMQAWHAQFLKPLYDGWDKKDVSLRYYYATMYLGQTFVLARLDDYSAAPYLEQAVQIANMQEDKCLYPKALYVLAGFYVNVQHDLLKGYEIIVTIRQYVDKERLNTIGDCNVDVYSAASVLDFYLADFVSAEHNLNTTIGIHRTLNKPPVLLYDLYKRRAINEIDLKAYDLVPRSIDSAEFYARATGDSTLFHFINALRFNNLASQKNYVQAKKYESQVDAEILKRDNDDYYEYMSNLIKLQIRERRYDDAWRNIAAYEQLLKPWNIQRWRLICDVKYLLAKQTGDHKAALEAYEQFKFYDDSVHRQRQNLQILQQHIKYETREKEKSLADEVALNGVFSKVIIGGTLMACIIIALISFNYYRSRKNERVLSNLNGQLNERKRDLETAIGERDRILHVVAHDLRSPVGGIAYFADMTMMEEDLSDNVKRNLGLIKNTSDNVLELTSELLALNAVTHQRRTAVDMNDLVQETVDLLQFQAKKKNQEIVVKPSQEPIVTLVNKERVGRLIGNLVTNAIKFSPENSKVEVSAEARGTDVILYVKDNGIGIPQDQLPRLFEVFTTAKRKGTGGESSHGLGLSICKQIAEEHGGTITVVSEEKQGTSFCVTLPVAHQETA